MVMVNWVDIFRILVNSVHVLFGDMVNDHVMGSTISGIQGANPQKEGGVKALAISRGPTFTKIFFSRSSKVVANPFILTMYKQTTTRIEGDMLIILLYI